MNRDKEPNIDNALDQWRMHGVERDWDAVLRAGTQARRVRRPGFRITPPKRGGRYRLLLALTATSLVLVVTPALAVLTGSAQWVITGSAQWPWSSRLGASLAAEVRSSRGTVELHLNSRGALVYRSGPRSKPKFLTPVAKHRLRRFAWQLTTHGGEVGSAEILVGRRRIQLCAPCSSHQTGAFMLRGVAALAVLNGDARLSARINGQKLSRQIRLLRLR